MSVPTQTEILALLVETFTEGLPDRDAPDTDEPLLGADAQLDSMELVSFVSDVEDTLSERFGLEVILADERALSRSKSPFRSLNALAEYVGELLADAG